MRHKVYGKHLSRNKDKREALFKNLVSSLIVSEKIQTTETKAKAIKGLVDKIINQAKSANTKRLVAQFLTKKQVQEKLIKDLIPKLKGRTSGYTSIVKLGRRLGDGAMMVQMRLLLEDVKKHEQVIAKKIESKPKQAVSIKNQESRRKTTKSKKA